MTVYVDNMRAPFGRLVMCHMIADTEAELHELAAAIGIQRRWYQGDHYDIALSKRRLAVDRGARQITTRELGAMAMNRRAGGELGTPETAIGILQARLAARRSAGAVPLCQSCGQRQAECRCQVPQP